MHHLSKIVVAGCAILGLQAFLALAWSRSEYVPAPPPLSRLPSQIGMWRLETEHTLDPESLTMLSPDDVLDRWYTDAGNAKADTAGSIDLFVAYYKSQLRAKGAHDPKVCLPGAGWAPIESKRMSIAVPQGGTVISANHYVIQREQSKNVVIYWFQTFSGTTAEVESLRLSKLFSTIRQNRSDMALVRIVAPVDPINQDQSNRNAVDFAKAVYPALTAYFPPR